MAAAPARGLADPDLLEAVLCRLGVPSPGEAAREALRHLGGSFASVLCAQGREVRAVPRLGAEPRAAAALDALRAAAVRLHRARAASKPTAPDENEERAWTDYLAALMGRDRTEQFRVLFLAADGRLIADEAQSRGTVNHTPVYPREVVRRAREHGAAAIVLVHNHPSGDPTPSSDDMAMTARVRDAARALGIGLRDHIVVGNGRHLSFRREGLL